MRRLSIFVLGLIIALFLQQDSFATDSLKIGLVNIQRCMDESNEGKRITAFLNEKNESFKKQIETKQRELLELQKEIEKQSMMLSLDAQEDKRRQYETKGRDYQMLVQKLSLELKKEENDAKKEFIRDLQKIAQKIANEQSYNLILDRNVGVIFASETFDITDKVISEYNKLKP